MLQREYIVQNKAKLLRDKNFSKKSSFQTSLQT
jgi:hypothetical protein